MSPFALLNPAVAAAYHAVTAIAGTLAPITGDTSAALAILLFTITVRLLIHPLSRAQSRATARAQSARAALAPQLTKLRRKFRNDPAGLNRATLELYREHGISPAAGILPALAQLPVLLVMYRLFASRSIAGHTNTLLGHALAGVPLGSHLRDAFAAGHVALAHVAVFIALIAVVVPVARWSSVQIKATAEKAPAATTTAAESQTAGQLARWLPYASVLTVAFVPLATGLYVATTTLWTVAERAFLARGQL